MQINSSATKKIILTGGHAATTGIAVAEELFRRESGKFSWDIYWIGARSAVEGKNVSTIESAILPRMGIKHFPILSGRIQRQFTFWTIPSIAKIPFGFIHALMILRKIKPNIILSFGGFAAFPVVITGWLLRIPIVLHEQTVEIGRANKYSVFFARVVAVARKSSFKYLPRKKRFFTGNPVMTQVSEIEVKTNIGDPPVIFVTCGSRGSQNINSVIAKILPELLENYQVIHSTGYLDYDRFERIRANLPNKLLKNRYEIYSSIDPLSVDNVYRLSDIIVSRAGANTISEILIVKRPSIVIPLPFSYKNEQYKNAITAVKFGVSTIIQEKDLVPSVLLSNIKYMKDNWSKIVSEVKDKETPDKFASSKLVDLLEKFVQ